MHVYNTNQIAKINSETSLNINSLYIPSIIDTFGCHGLKQAELYWKGLLTKTYTINNLLDVFPSGQGNPILRKALDQFPNKNTAIQYRDTLLANYPDLLANPEVPGIHIICLDKYGYETLETRQRPKLDSVSNSFVEKLPFEKKRLAAMLLLEAVPGLNLLLSCSQSDIINLLNNDTINTEKGPAKGYYYMGFDKNIYYFNNTIVMAASSGYLDLPSSNIHYELENTAVSYLNKVESGIKQRIQDIFKEGAVVFTTDDISKKMSHLIAHVVTATQRARKKQPVVPKDAGVFKLEDGTPYDLYAFRDPATNPVKNQNIGSLSNNANLQGLIDRQMNGLYGARNRLRRHKEEYEHEAALHPNLVPYVKNIPSYLGKSRHLVTLSRLSKKDLADTLKYEKYYDIFVWKYSDVLNGLHPDIWEYLRQARFPSVLDKIKQLQKFIKDPNEAAATIDAWLEEQIRREEEIREQYRRNRIQQIVEEEEEDYEDYGYNSNNSYMRGQNYGPNR